MEQYFVNQTIDSDELILDDQEQFRHIITVLRHKVGDEIYFVDEKKNLYKGVLKNINDKKAVFSLEKSSLPSTELPVDAIIACSLSKKDKIEWITQKSTELGASKVIFFNSRYSVMQWKDNVVEKKLSRLQEIAKNAAQQSKRRFIPEVQFIKNFAELKNVSADLKLIAYEESAKQGESSRLAQALQKNQSGSVLAVFGPEGGFSPEEVSELSENDFLEVGLGPRILRAETAPLYLLSVLSYNYELLANEE